ncbi:diguanylate phosphodiesterase [Thermovibrio ammonificans HB-1]|uniref:Diguanylate phosphodiesterase n=1 Tax=Thermovibrio ammonificans (strain DSM 15698 / JCM 12110 / HB-1) TaxID=648996 RepID=E8T3I1_THEA1|nr:EAL domain-containing protein [Thermovibrio ammonificans]ADU96112.1 diguanylate phosphodiesterase [Thermovibrio ammonificans HB-1]
MDRESLKLLKSLLPDFLKEIEREFSRDPFVREFVKEERAFKELVKLQKTLLNLFLENLEGKNRLNGKVEESVRLYQVPYVAIYRAVTAAKEKLVEQLAEKEIDRLQLFEVSRKLQKLLNAVARAYLKKEALELRRVLDSPFKEHLLFKKHAKWIEELSESIADLELSRFPLKNYKECEFTKVLNYPESLMVCMDKNLCSYLDELHRLIHKLADSLYYYCSKKQFNEAYLVFKDLKEQVIRFTQVLGELYFVTYSDLEHSFFKLIQFLQREGRITVFMVDFQGLKSLNAIYGEGIVTGAIKEIIKRLKREIEPETELLIKGVTADLYLLTTGSGKRLLEKVEKALKEPAEAEGKRLHLKALVVGVELPPFGQVTPEELIKVFSNLKKEAKKLNRDRLYLSGNEGQRKIEEILNEKYNEHFVLKKIKNGEVDVVFQPIYTVDTRELFTLEVLGRIKDGEKLIPAGIFIDAIYNLHLIEEFDTLVIKRLKEKANLIKRITNRLFINVSFQSLLDPNYIKELQSFVESFGETGVTLELTEQRFVENTQVVEEVSKNHKIYFIIDDFGKGYSSLRTLVELAKKGILKFLKIDGTLIKDVESDSFVKKVIKIISTLGEELQVGVVGEFVENEETVKVLQELGVQYAQGYYLSKPLTLEELLVKIVEEG